MKIVNLLEEKMTRAGSYGAMALIMGAKSRAASDVPAIAERISKLRVWRGGVQKDVCEETGINPSRWSNWEAGTGRPDLEGAIRVVEALGVTLDWIYFGDTSGLPSGIASELARVKPEKPVRGRRRAAA